MSTVLVTGGSGFVGSHVVDKLLAAGHDVRILDMRRSPYVSPGAVRTVIGDVRDLDDVRKASRGCEVVIHLAAAADVGEVAADPAAAEHVNARGTLAVLQAARDEGVQRVIYASTVWVYSDVEQECVDEETPLRAPSHLYSATKLAGELYCRSYGALYGLETTILRFGIPYGPRSRPAAVVPSFVQRALDGQPLMLAGGGLQSRRFVYVEDLAEGVVRALSPIAANRTYNLVSEVDITIREVAAAVQNAVGDAEIVHTEGRPGDFGGVVVLGERAADELGWRANTPFVEGVRRYVEWHRSILPAKPPLPVRAFAAAESVVLAARAGARSMVAFALGLVALVFAIQGTGSEAVHDIFGVACVLALAINARATALGQRSSDAMWLTSGLVFGWFLADVPDEAHHAAARLAWLLLGLCPMIAANALARRSAIRPRDRAARG